MVKQIVRGGPRALLLSSLGADLTASPRGPLPAMAVLGAIQLRDQPTKLHGITGDFRIAGDRRLAGTIKCGEESPFASNRRRGVGMIDERKNSDIRVPIVARFDADGALPDCRQKFIHAHDLGGVPDQPKSLQARQVRVRSHQFRRRQACAAASLHCRAAASCADLAARAWRSPAGAAMRCQARAARQFAEGARLMADEDIAWVLALKAGRQRQSVRQNRWHVFGGMYGKIDAPSSKASSISLVNSPLPPLPPVAGPGWCRRWCE